ncbi:hypothetical protein S7S_09335 [Isoalcanivorax pacificus W11-5]|uniref:Uncharacterized protein n=1 Tax=Isoalcanivorax pacificus W11-5 TaxID=391936 RepID=A0A0B4XJ01_9GAMM|nr:hypothetical protein [Isoalcanivorax pacificus]AJD48279.1 hypothetical protein S7S_09335 [Isoalcanivorax pacificus W11-5]
MNVANRISTLAEQNDVEFEARGNDANDIAALAEALEIELDYAGSDDNALDFLEAELAEAA